MAYESLGALLYQLGRESEAAKVYTDWSAREPSNAKASHMAAAMSGQNSPSRASNEHVRQLFDASAESFDAALERLDYYAPPAVAKALAQRAHGKLPTVLDAVAARAYVVSSSVRSAHILLVSICLPR